MQALIVGLAFPVITLLIRKTYQGKQEISQRQWLIRYAVYALSELIMVSTVMFFLCDEGTSFAAKMDASPLFVLKFIAVYAFAALAVAVMEWMKVTGKFAIRVDREEWEKSSLYRVSKKYLFPAAIYLAAFAVVALNVSLMFDNVLWGDECFSANTARKDVDGILQVMYFWDNHPPLHYYWTKLFGELFGHTGPVYHLAALTPFLAGIVMAITFLRKHFGDVPAAFFVIITGLAAPCLQYNVEIRMYSLAFWGVAAAFYCSYRALSGGKAAWFFMVFWGLVGAYSHYYAMMTAGILIVITGVAYFVRFRGKAWIKGVAALIAYIVGYAPWLRYLFTATNNVSNNWWMTEILGLKEAFRMLFFGQSYEKILLVLFLFLLAAVLLITSSFFSLEETKDCTVLTIRKPSLKGWTNETYGLAVGALTLVGTVIAAYVLCLIVGPVLNPRYLYPVSALTVLLLVMGSAGVLKLAKDAAAKYQKNWVYGLVRAVLVLSLLVLTLIGVNNYRADRTNVKAEQAVTEATLQVIGEVDPDTAMISNNVKHLGWTVLYYYYPDQEIENGRCSEIGMEYDRFWYFTPESIGKGELREMEDAGYRVESYGSQQIAVYPFELYYFERVK